MRILIAEDDKKLSSYLKKLFSNYEHEVDVINNGSEIEYYAHNSQYDILILDWMLPGKDGVEACFDLRKSGYAGTILMLTARSELADKIKAFNCGADDYLPKPFDFEELYVRTKALLRRSANGFRHDIFEVDSCIFDCTEKTVACSGQKTKLTKKEFEIVELLARNAKRVVTREIILERAWGAEKSASINSLEVYVKMIRTKLKQISGKEFIHNIRSVGYRWEEHDV